MSLSLILLLITFALTCFIVGKKTYLLRTGKLDLYHEERPWRVSHEARKLYKVLAFIGKRIFKSIIFSLGKLYVTVEHRVKKFLQAKFPKYFKEKEVVSQKPSFFISTMQEYKVRMRRHKKTIQEKEKDFEEEDVVD